MQASITQVTFTTEASLKNQALEKARREGITLKALLTMAMRSYISNNLTVGVRSSEEGEYNPDFVKKVLKNSKNKPTHRFKDKASFLESIQ